MSTTNQNTINIPDLNKTITISTSESPNRIEISADGSVGESFSDAEGESF